MTTSIAPGDVPPFERLPVKRSLRSRFVVTSLVLLFATVVTGLWSWIVFVRLGRVVDRTLEGRQAAIDLAATMTTALEREDDALLLAISGELERAHTELRAQRAGFDTAFASFAGVGPDDERVIASALGEEVAMYRRRVDTLLASLPRLTVELAHQYYHAEVNPTLRHAIAACHGLREHSFRALRDAGLTARSEATRGTWMVALVSLVALVVATMVLLFFARSVLRPIRALTSSVDAMRRGDFNHRVERAEPSELANLTDGFNRMAESLAAFQSSNLGEVLRAKDTLEATIGALPDPVVVVDASRAIASLNPPARTVLGDAAATLADTPPAVAAQIRIALGGTRSRAELRDAFAVEFGGERRTFLPTAVPIPLAGNKIGAVAVLHDITEFVRLDTLRGELIAVASHELKTPLTTLRMNVLLLGEDVGRLTPHQREVVAMATQGCEELALTIDRLLDLTRIESGKLRLALERVDVYRIIDVVLASLEPRLAEAELTVDVAREAGDAFVRADATRLGIVVSNLMTNAIKYTPPNGTIAIAVRSRGGRIEVAVTDTGSGVPADLRERVFEKFFRVAHVRPDPGDPAGAGIGLYLARQIVEAHAGDITCDDVTQGACFSFRLPVEPV
ncbi:MAG: HAMP domain-containing protein [Deltaproteobacteria bacterium]|nr:HAMP domain-containing protein [Deltaproteobacteria bacterium]MCW5806241.1 HAMP domain-containing protein [Deltaproteobacteria bacterium]